MLRLLYSLKNLWPKFAQFKNLLYLCSPFPPLNERHVDDHLSISSVLAFSEQQDTLIAAQQQVTQSVMDNNHILREALKQEQERADYYQQLYETEKTKNQQLEARVKQLEERPNIVADHYFEHFTANNVLTVPKQTGKRSKSKHIDNPNQLFLELWKDNPTGIL